MQSADEFLSFRILNAVKAAIYVAENFRCCFFFIWFCKELRSANSMYPLHAIQAYFPQCPRSSKLS